MVRLALNAKPLSTFLVNKKSNIFYDTEPQINRDLSLERPDIATKILISLCLYYVVSLLFNNNYLSLIRSTVPWRRRNNNSIYVYVVIFIVYATRSSCYDSP